MRRGFSRFRRPITVFSEPNLEAILNGSMNFATSRCIYRSPSFNSSGYTAVECFLTLSILFDSAPSPDLAIVGRLAQSCGSAGAFGPWAGIGALVPAAWVPKDYNGPGPYTLALIAGGGGTQVQTPTLALGAAVELWACGWPAGRELRIALDGSITAGATR